MDFTKATSREEVRGMLEGLTRAKLVEIGKQFKVYITPKDKKEMVIQKIVESAIGVRLRSEAIRAIDLSRKERY